ncbi:sensor histidine kinase [Paractinoplanes ferrugineus]|uniref:histidine kinase n=1 Tax=Paractinoplanes ferrugineus TaxID=113564 RepID=A0A919J0A1_9ACTN|nr:histidine kinase [Actinoplanes ferrugineus]GIE12130.1 two-component sensor histidine kinase [Actinoplanes ferrugineus]
MRPRDAAVPAALILVGLATLPLIDLRSATDQSPDWLAAVLVVAAGAVPAWRRRWPVPALLAATSITLAYLLVGYPYGPVLLSIAVCVWSVARSRRPQSAAAWSVVALVLLMGHVLFGGPGPAGLIPGLAWVVVPFTLGAARRQVVEAQQRERAETERRLVDDERLRLAQEVHDVVGHGLAAIQMQAEVALHLRHTRPELAHEALAAISAASAEALDELRATLSSVLPAGLSRVGELCDRVRSAGVVVELSVDGTPRPLPAAADLVAYRVLQEALTNVVKHSAEPHARVAIHHQPGGVDLSVVNQAAVADLSVADLSVADLSVADQGGGAGPRVVDRAGGAGHSEGFGLSGMRRRVEHLGGRFDAGPRDGTFAVTAVIPRRSK